MSRPSPLSRLSCALFPTLDHHHYHYHPPTHVTIPFSPNLLHSAQSQALAHNFGHLLASRLLLGLGECLNGPTSYAIISVYFPPHLRGIAVGVYACGIYLGGGLASLSILISQQVNGPSHFIARMRNGLQQQSEKSNSTHPTPVWRACRLDGGPRAWSWVASASVCPPASCCQ